MTDDDLRAMWVYGASLKAMSEASGRNKVNLQSHIRRLRHREGEERWPKRGSGPIEAKPPQSRPQRAGASTLPPLASLGQERANLVEGLAPAPTSDV